MNPFAHPIAAYLRHALKWACTETPFQPGVTSVRPFGPKPRLRHDRAAGPRLRWGDLAIYAALVLVLALEVG